MEDLKSKAGYRFKELLGADAFYDHLEDVVRQFRKQFNLPVASLYPDPAPEGVGRGA
jgi:hypothetical protein